jgi:hypothetical protein
MFVSPASQPVKKLKVQNMNKSSIKNFQPEQKPNSKQKADEKHVCPAIGNTNVVCWSGRFGVKIIEIYVKIYRLTFEQELRLIGKWLMFIYQLQPFSKSQRQLFPNRWKLFWLKFWNSPISLFVSVIVAILLSLLLVYLSTNYIMK